VGLGAPSAPHQYRDVAPSQTKHPSESLCWSKFRPRRPAQQGKRLGPKRQSGPPTHAGYEGAVQAIVPLPLTAQECNENASMNSNYTTLAGRSLQHGPIHFDAPANQSVGPKVILREQRPVASNLSLYQPLAVFTHLLSSWLQGRRR
jgi:hypothetical protein